MSRKFQNGEAVIPIKKTLGSSHCAHFNAFKEGRLTCLYVLRYFNDSKIIVSSDPQRISGNHYAEDDLISLKEVEKDAFSFFVQGKITERTYNQIAQRT